MRVKRAEAVSRVWKGVSVMERTSGSQIQSDKSFGCSGQRDKLFGCSGESSIEGLLGLWMGRADWS